MHEVCVERRLENTIEKDQPQERCGREHGRQQTVLPNTVPDALAVDAHGATSHMA